MSTSLILNHIDKGRCRRSRQKSGASRKSSPLALPPKKTSGELEKEARDAMRRSNAYVSLPRKFMTANMPTVGCLTS